MNMPIIPKGLYIGSEVGERETFGVSYKNETLKNM